MNLVIVESPAKANTIYKYLGNNYIVLASYGHVRDLPSKNGSVDPNNNFQMLWEIDSFSKKYLNERSNYLHARDQVIEKFPIQPTTLFKHLRNVLPKNSAITLDAGTLCLQATDALKYYDPPSLFTP